MPLLFNFPFSKHILFHG
uniref:Uncharacterized protein n=1 Tax=Anguilla anguilla TaxID=7936 RepID=A0A0E9U5G2_ANGAN